MVLRYYSNAPATTLTAGVTALDTTLPVASTAGLPAQFPFTLILDRGTSSEEAVSVTALAGLNLTVVRAIDGTTAFAHSSGAVVEHGITAQDVREPNTHVNSTSDVHGVAGALVGADFVTAAILASHPVGSIYFHTVDTNPSTFLGGTWVAWGSGRVPVGVDAAQTEFDTSEKTGGAKTHTLTTAEMPSHTHIQDAHSHLTSTANLTAFGTAGDGAYSLPADTSPDGVATSSAVATNQSTGGGAAHNNLQPYIAVFMFKRTA